MSTDQGRPLMHASTHVIFSTDDLAVLERRLGPDHGICKRLRLALVDCADPTLAKYRASAMRQIREGELEIDAGAVVSKGDDAGAYVMAWLWISDELAGINRAAKTKKGGAR